MAIKPIEGFYVHDEETNTDGVARVSIDAVQDLTSNLVVGNASNVIRDAIYKEKTSYRVRFSMNADYSVTVSGTATGTALYDFYSDTSSFPAGLESGQKVYIDYASTNVDFRVYLYIDGDWRSIIWTRESATFTIPSNATGIILRLAVPNGTTVDETVSAKVWSATPNAELTSDIAELKSSVLAVPSVTWSKGLLTAAGVINTSSNGVYSNIIEHMSRVHLDTGVRALVFLYIGGAYVGKISANGTVNTTSGDWKYYTGKIDIEAILDSLDVDVDGVRLTLSPTDGYSITDGNAQNYGDWKCNVICDKYVSDFDTVKQVAVLPEILSEPMYPFYKDFRFALIDTTDGLAYGNPSWARCMTIARFDKPWTITTLDPDYSIGLYWYEESTLHSKLWDTIWEVPANVDVAIVMRRHEASSNPESMQGEKPWLALRKLNDTPKDYFLKEIEDVIDRVNEANSEPGLCFLLSTDQHTMTVINWLLKYDSISDMVTNMKAVAKEINFDGHISLGDIADFKVPASEAVAKRFGITDTSNANLDEIFAAWRKYGVNQLFGVHPNFIYLHGNHDDNRYINTDVVHASVSDWDYTREEMYAYYISKSQMNRVSNDSNNGLDYYIDYPQHKIRMFCLDANFYNDTSKSWDYGYDDNTASWFDAQLREVPEGWSVLLLTHMSPIAEHNPDNWHYRNFDNVKASIEDFIEGGGDYIATLYGHAHCDWSVQNPWLEICFAAQKCQTPNFSFENMTGAEYPTRTLGTATEDCWNVVMVQPKSRKIKVVRFGAGNDKEFTY